MTTEVDYDPEAFRQFEHDGWTEVAANYHRSFGQLTRQCVTALMDAAEVKRGNVLLDLACGTGLNAEEALARGADVTGLDLTQAMVDEASRRCPDATFQVGDAEAMPFEDGNFDVVVCGFGILHFPLPQIAVHEIHRVLKPGGRFACSVWCPVDRSPFLQLVQNAMAAHGNAAVELPAGPPAYQFGDPTRLTSLLEGAGFDAVRCQDAPIHVIVEDESQVFEALMEGGVRSRKLIEAQSTDAQKRIEQHAVEAAAAFRKADRVSIPRPALIGVGTKP